MFPVYTLVFNWLQFGDRYFSEWKVFLIATAIVLGACFIVFRLVNILADIVRRRYMHFNDMPKRMALIVTLAFIAGGAAATVVFYGYDYIHFMGYELNIENYGWALLATFFNVLIITLLSEGSITVGNWKETIAEAEQLRKINLQCQLEGLKEQVNPHFLFNSLNSLSSLIGESPQQASKFLDEMSKVYRYLLRNNEDGLTTLTNELQFIRSYFHLLKTRYGDGIDLKINVDALCMNSLLPPLTLQMLVENAVRHNSVLKEAPLKIEIINHGNKKLIVKNSLQMKEARMPSARAGLQNIINKYRLLNQPEVIIYQTDKEFLVTVPLLQQK